jgi:uncharacterized protein YfiM (DUF2279 family)
LFFEAQSPYVAQFGLDFTILLPQLSKYWDYKCAPYSWLRHILLWKIKYFSGKKTD